MPAGVGGFISFHVSRKRNISQALRRLFHILRQQNISPKLFPSIRIYLLKNSSPSFFNEINPFRDLRNALRAWNIASQCEMPAGVGGFISFHVPRKRNISQALRRLFHIRRIFHFTFPLLFKKISFILRIFIDTLIISDIPDMACKMDSRHWRRAFSQNLSRFLVLVLI